MATTTAAATEAATATTRTEPIYVLYGSQTGNSEQAAKDFCTAVGTKLSPEVIRNAAAPTAGGGSGGSTAAGSDHTTVTVETRLMQLDDFLELERCRWTRVIVIFTSSYGVGQAPIGCHRFRQLCDEWLDQYGDGKGNDAANANAADGNSKGTKLLDGLQFAMCGLGDSKYTTFFRNPTRIHDALTLLGARRVGSLGKADASGIGDLEQQAVIASWMDSIWSDLATILATEPPPSLLEQLSAMRQETVKICREINPEFPADDDDTKSDGVTMKGSSSANGQILIVSAAVAVAAVVVYYSVS